MKILKSIWPLWFLWIFGNFWKFFGKDLYLYSAILTKLMHPGDPCTMFWISRHIFSPFEKVPPGIWTRVSWVVVRCLTPELWRIHRGMTYEKHIRPIPICTSSTTTGKDVTWHTVTVKCTWKYTVLVMEEKVRLLNIAFRVLDSPTERDVSRKHLHSLP